MSRHPGVVDAMTRRDPWRGSSTPMALLQRIRTARPFPYRRGFMVGCMALMWAAGGLTVLATCVLFPTPGLDRAAAVTIGLLALLISAGVAAFGTRMPDWAFPTVSVGGAAVVAALMVAGGGGVTSVAFSVFLLWVVLYALLFFPGPVAAMVVTTAGAAFGVAFVVLDDVPVLVPLVLLSTFGITGVVVASLTRARDAAATDALTGLANRRGFDLALEHAIRRAEVDGHPVCVAVLDVDRFKQVNERYGGDAADRLLRAVAERWRELLPIGSFLGRLGGDEFAIVLPGLAADAAEPAVDRLRAATPAGVTASAGVTAWRSGDSLSMLLGRAEAALYEAKRAGRDRTWVTRDDSRAVAELRRAIRSDELLLHYQPKASLRTGRIVGFEALVRWQHPERGLLPPSEFIRLAEDSGCIVELGAWVLDTAIRQAAAWRAAHPDHHIEVAANVAGRQLDDEDFLDRLSASLHRHALPASRLCLEVTESMLSEDLDRWVEVLTGARRLGVQVAMDDFGTGYSSLHQLRHLPVNVIKIDRAFVGDLADSADARTLVTAMIGIAKGLERSVVAEGVETIEQLNVLTALGCEHAQGFLLGRPLPGEAATALLAQQRRVDGLLHQPRAAALDRGGPVDAAELAALVADERSLHETARPLLAHLVAASGFESAYLTRIDWERLEQEIVSALNTGALEITEGAVVDWSDALCRRSLEHGPARTANVPAELPGSRAAERLGLRSYATTPVVLGNGTVYGTLCVASRDHDLVSDDVMALLSMYGRIIAERVEADAAAA